MAPYILADEKGLVELPDSLTYIDGAQVACGFGTVYEALEKIGVSGDDAVLVVGPGPDALAQLRELSGGQRFEKAVDCSAHPDGRALAIRATRQWGKIALVGEGNSVSFNPSPDLIHDQKTSYGSWVTSIWRMEDLVERLVRWNIHPEDLVTHRFALEEAGDAYRLMASGAARWRWYSIEKGGTRAGAVQGAPEEPTSGHKPYDFDLRVLLKGRFGYRLYRF